MQPGHPQLELFSVSPGKRAEQARLKAEPVPVPAVHEARETARETSARDAGAPGLLPLPSKQQTLARARGLAERIATYLGPELKVHLTVHDNRSTMISFRRQLPLVRIRAHHMFLEAPDAVVKSIADYAGRGKQAAGAVLDSFIAAQQALIRAYPRKPSPLDPRGECFDLQALFDDINAKHFDSKIVARIGWGRLPGKRRRKSIRLGVYDHKAREIRIHPALDRPDVPRFFVEFIVFHEMLHQLFPSDRDTGRHVHHPRAFRDREQAWPKYQAALAWEKEHLAQLLRR
ncbi:MAG: hypothetical protein U0228_02305 [Myxococcaceae bacterium]